MKNDEEKAKETPNKNSMNNLVSYLPYNVLDGIDINDASQTDTLSKNSSSDKSLDKSTKSQTNKNNNNISDNRNGNSNNNNNSNGNEHNNVFHSIHQIIIFLKIYK